MAHGMDLQLWETVLSPCIWVIRPKPAASVVKMALRGQAEALRFSDMLVGGWHDWCGRITGTSLFMHACGWLTQLGWAHQVKNVSTTMLEGKVGRMYLLRHACRWLT